MELALSATGDPLSSFLGACKGRTVDLSDAKGGVHPLQAVPQRWRTVAQSLKTFVAELARVEADVCPDGSALIEAWRRLVYDATELFDSYYELLPARVKPRDRPESSSLKGFKVKAKKYRDFCAKLCNRMKHEGAEIAFLWAVSPSNGVSGSRYLVRVYRDGNSLVRDDVIHGGRMAGRGLVRDAQELVHHLLRVDCAAGALIQALGDGMSEALPDVSLELPVGASVRTLAALRPTCHADESRLHDGIIFRTNCLRLCRVSADDFGASATIRTSLKIEGPTTSYSVA